MLGLEYLLFIVVSGLFGIWFVGAMLVAIFRKRK